MTTSHPSRLSVLICGGGIAGATLACLLARAGHHTTVVERDQAIRSSGNPVDVRRAAFDVMENLDLISRLRDLAAHVRRLVLVDNTGRPITSMPTRRSQERELEIPRADLTAVLVTAARADTEFRFDDSVLELESDDHGVDVTFHHAPPQRFDLVVGADGMHSAVRRLAFGPELDYLTHLGLYVATVTLPHPADRADTILMHNQPGAATALHPSTGSPTAIFIFLCPVRVEPRHRGAADRLLADTYQNAGWRAPEFLAAYRAAPDHYFDSVSRIKVPAWTRGRITLLGDAASSVSLFGEGPSSAIVGAATFATSLARSPRNVPAALAQYETTHRPVAARGQRAAPFASHLLVPAVHNRPHTAQPCPPTRPRDKPQEPLIALSEAGCGRPRPAARAVPWRTDCRRGDTPESAPSPSAQCPSPSPDLLPRSQPGLGLPHDGANSG